MSKYGGSYSADDINKKKKEQTNQGAANPGKYTGSYSADDIARINNARLQTPQNQPARQFLITGDSGLDAANAQRVQAGNNPVYTDTADKRNQLRLDKGLGLSVSTTPAQQTPEQQVDYLDAYLKEVQNKKTEADAKMKNVQAQWTAASLDTGFVTGKEDRATYEEQRGAVLAAYDQAKKEKEYLEGLERLAKDHKTGAQVIINGDEDLFQQYMDARNVSDSNVFQDIGFAMSGTVNMNSSRARDSMEAEKLRAAIKAKGYTDEQISEYINFANDKKTEALRDDIRAFAQAHPVIAEAVSKATAPIRGIAGTVGAIVRPGERNSPFNVLNTYSETVQETNTQAIQDAVKSKVGGKAGEFLGWAATTGYQAASASAESLIVMGAGGYLGEVLMGLNAAAETYNEGLNKGLSTSRSLISGVAAGIFETLFEHLSLENLRNMKATGKEGFGNACMDILKQFVTEGSEEVFTDLANELYDYLMNGGMSSYERTVREYTDAYMADENISREEAERKAQKKYALEFAKQLGESMVVGGLSGAMSAGTIRGELAAGRAGAYMQSGRSVQIAGQHTEGGVKAVLQPLAENLKGTDAGKALEGISEKTGRYKTGKAVTAAVQQATQAQVDTAKSALTEIGYADAEAEKKARAFVRVFNGDISADTVQAFMAMAEDEKGTDALMGLLGEDTEFSQRRSAMDEFRRNVIKGAEQHRGFAQKIAERLDRWVNREEIAKADKRGEIADASMEAVDAKNTEALVNETKAETADGKVRVRGIGGVEDGKVRVIVDAETNATAALDEVTFPETKEGIRDRAIYTGVAEMMQGAGEYRVKMSAEAANLAVAFAQNTTGDADVILQELYTAYAAGSVLRNRDTFKIESELEHGEAAFDAMYAAGAKEYKAKAGVTRVGTRDLTEAQVNELKVLDRVFQKMGVALVITDSLYATVNGKKIRLYGETNDKTKAIYVGLKDGNNDNMISVAAFHELFHWMKYSGKVGEKAQRGLVQAVVRALKNDKNLNYDEIYEQRAAVYEELSQEEIEEEIAAQYFGTVLADRMAASKVFTSVDSGVLEKIRAHLEAFFMRVHDEINAFAARTNDKAMLAALNGDYDRGYKMLEAFDIALGASLEETRKGQTEQATEEKERVSHSYKLDDETGKKYPEGLKTDTSNMDLREQLDFSRAFDQTMFQTAAEMNQMSDAQDLLENIRGLLPLDDYLTYEQRQKLNAISKQLRKRMLNNDFGDLQFARWVINQIDYIRSFNETARKAKVYNWHSFERPKIAKWIPGDDVFIVDITDENENIIASYEDNDTIVTGRYSRVIDQDAQEYVKRLEQENDAQREEISLLRTMYEELKRVTRERNGKLPKRSRLEEIVKKYIFNDPTDTYHRKEVVDKIYKLLNDVYDGKTSFHSFAWDMRGIVQSEVENAGHWYEDGDSIYKQFRQEFRTQDGNKTRMVTIYIADDIYKTIAEKYGGRAQFRNAMFGKMNVTSDSTRGAMGLDAFYDSLVQGNYGLEETTDPGTQIENILAMWNADPKMWVADNLSEWFGRSQTEVVNDLTMGLITDVVNDANVLMGAETEIYAEKMAEIRAQMRQATQQKIDAAVKAATAAGDRAAAKIQNDPKKTTTEAEAEISAARQQEIQAALARAYEARLREQAAQMRRSYQTEQEKKEIRRRIRTMRDMLIKNTTTKNVPQPMKGKIKSLIQFFLNDSEIFSKKERHWLEIELARLKTPEENGPTYDFTKFNEQIAEEFANVKARLEERGGRFGEGMRLRYMTPVQIDIVSAYTENLLHVLQEANESFLEARNGNALEDGETGLQELKQKAQAQKATKNPVKILVKKLLDSGYLTSFYTFNEYIGGVIGEYFQSITRAESNSGLKLREISNFFEGLQKKYKYLNYKKETHLLRLTCYETRAGEEEDRLTHTVTWDVELTTENCMQIYAWYNRELKSGQESAHLVPKVNADGEIVGGGVVLDRELSESQNKALQKLERIKEMKDVGKASKKNEAYLEFLREHGKEANLAADKNRHLLTEEAVEAIIGVLTEEQKQCADEVVHFLSNTGSAWGNAASQKWYGVRLFEEDYYFPYETPAEFSSRRFGMTSEKRLKDWGASKRTMVEAKTPLVLSSFFDVAARHAYEMAMYSEFLVPVEQMSQLLSYKNLELEDASIQSMIKTVYGEKTWSYITEFMDQLNGGVRADDVDSMINRMTSIFKGGAVMANFSVVVQQPTALLRATAMMDPKYLEFGNVNGSRLTTGLKKEDYEEMLEYSGVAVLKEKGGFDTNMGNSITADLLGRQTWRSRMNSFTGWGAGMADILTWTHLWNAAKRETADKHTYHYDPMDPAYEEAANAVKRKQPDLDVNSEAFGKTVEHEQMLYDARDRFEDIVRHTQVYDSIITKNKWMRSGGGLAKMVTAFMGEPTLSLNLLLMSGENRTIKRSRAIGAFLANIVVNSLAQGLVGAWRHRDEDETFFESWLEEFVSNLIGDYHVLFLDGAWSPFGMIPWIKDVISMMQGYDVARTDMSAVGELIDAAKVMIKRITMGDKDITTWGAPNAEDYADLVFAISKMFGVPAGNVWREIKGITESAMITFGDPKWHFDGMALMDAVERGIGIEQSDQYRAYKAVLHNDAELIRRMTAVDAEAVNKLIEKGYSEDDAMMQAEYDAKKKFDQKVAEGLKRYDPEKRIQAAAQSLYTGEIDKYEEIRRGLLEDGFSNNAIQTAIDAAVAELRPTEEKEAKEATEKPAYSTKNLDDALKQDNYKAYNDIADRMIAEGQITQKQAYNRAKNYAQDRFEETLDAAQAKLILTRNAGYSSENADALIGKWQFEEQHPDSTLTDSRRETWENSLKNVISVERFETYIADVATVKAGTGDIKERKKGVVQLIKAITNDRDARLALWTAAGYGESTFDDEKWD